MARLRVLISSRPPSHLEGENAQLLIWIICIYMGSHLEFAAGATALLPLGGDTRIGTIMDTAIMPAIR